MKKVELGSVTAGPKVKVANVYDDAQIRSWMRMAVDLGKKSISEGDPTKPYVGAVVVKDGHVVGSGYRGMTQPGHHAEFGVLQGISDPGLLEDAVVFSTLEPCSARNHPKIPCARRLVEAKVSEVHIGIYDPNPIIYRQGWKILHDGGISLRDFPHDLRDEIAVDNAAFLARYKTASGDAGIARFDAGPDGGEYTIKTSIGNFVIKVSPGPWVYDHNNKIALVRFATEFSQIDDPGALEFKNYYTSVYPGQIACLRSQNGFLLIKRTRLEPGTPGNVAEFEFEARGSIE
jgi:pyrimidine deaminase RibD-like protein